MHAEARHLLHTSLEQALGPEPAVLLMDELAACATKDDLRELKHELVHDLDLRFAVVNERFAAVDGQLTDINRRLDTLVHSLHHELRASSRTLFFQMAGLMIVLLTASGLLQR